MLLASSLSRLPAPKGRLCLASWPCIVQPPQPRPVKHACLCLRVCGVPQEAAKTLVQNAAGLQEMAINEEFVAWQDLVSSWQFGLLPYCVCGSQPCTESRGTDEWARGLLQSTD